MAKTLQVRDLPEEVHAALRARAAASGVSLSALVRMELEQVARQWTMEAVLERLNAELGEGGLDRSTTIYTLDAVRAERDAQMAAW